MAGYGGGHPDECVQCGSPPWESCWSNDPCTRHGPVPPERFDPQAYREDYETFNSDYDYRHAQPVRRSPLERVWRWLTC